MTNFLEETKDLHFVILYGSQLGQAKSISEGLADTAEQEHNLRTKVFALNDVPNITDLPKLGCPIVIVASTTGDGDPPENADKFWRKIRRKNLDKKTLSLVRYAILGLGDTNFNNFCNCAKTIHQRLQELGATVFFPPGWADDGTGIEVVVDEWTENLWPALKKAIGVQKLGADNQEQTDPISSEGSAGSKDPAMNGTTESPGSAPTEAKALTLPLLPTKSLLFEYGDESNGLYDPLSATLPYPLIDGLPVTAVISGAKVLTKQGAVKTTLQVTIDVPEGFDFEPGDSIGIVCSNHSGEVEAILKHLGLEEHANKQLNIKLNSEVPKAKHPPHIPTETTIRDIFTHICDIRTPPKKAFLRYLAESCSNESEKIELLTLSSKQGSAEYSEKILSPGLSLLDIFLKYPSCKPDAPVLVEHLPRLQPRAYSVCSSPLDSRARFDIAFNVIEIPKEEPRQYARLGICTGALLELCKENFKDTVIDAVVNAIVETEVINAAATLTNQIVVYRRKNQNFRLPTDLSKPIVMVGPGTGVAPFIGFLRHRQIQAKMNSEETLGNSVLYFGCRNKEKDLLYEDELNKFTSDRILWKLYVSFSRDEDQDGIKYVQDRMLQNKEELVSLLTDDECYFYVCGDAKNMARNVREALIKCFEDVKGLENKDAMAVVNNLVLSKRYLQDVWA